MWKFALSCLSDYRIGGNPEPSPLSHHFPRPLAAAATLGAILAVVPSAPASAASWEIAPHRAVYSLDLAVARGGATVSDVGGRMAFQWGESCDGWTIEQTYDMTLYYQQGGAVTLESRYASWESKDGLRFTFTNRNSTNGVVDEETRGEATLPAPGEAGEAVLRLPEEVVYALPAGTMFPTAHTLRLLDMATGDSGDRFFVTYLFDGTEADETLELSSVIGPRVEPADTGDPLLDRPSWRIDMAYFLAASRGPLPDYEIGVQLLDNGVVTEILIDYGDFSVRADLEEIEPIEGGC